MNSFVLGAAALLCCTAGLAQSGTDCVEGVASVGLPGFPNDEVRAVALFDGGGGPTLYIGGLFNEVDGQNAPLKLARSNGSTFVPVLQEASADVVYALAEGRYPGGERALYIGGEFLQVGGLNVGSRLIALRQNGQISSIPGMISGVKSPNVQSIATIEPFGQQEALVVFTGDFSSVSGSLPAPGVAEWNGSGSIAPLPPTPNRQSLGFVRGCATIDLDGPDGPQDPVIAIFGTAQLEPEFTSAVRVYNGVEHTELGPVGGQGWLSGTVRAIAQGDPDGPGPFPWTVYVAGNNLMGGAGSLAQYDAATGEWSVINPTYVGPFANPIRLDTLAFVPGEPPSLITSLATEGEIVNRFTPLFPGTDSPTLEYLAELNEIGPTLIANPENSPNSVIVAGNFREDFDFAPSELAAPYNARQIARLQVEGDLRLLPVQADASIDPPLPDGDFTSSIPINALGTWDSDGDEATAPVLVAAQRFDASPFNPTQIGSTTIERELAIRNPSNRAWEVLPGRFSLLGTQPPTFNAIVSHDPDGGFGSQPHELVVGGVFDDISGQPVSAIAAFDGVSWTPLLDSNGQFGPIVNDIVSDVIFNVLPAPKGPVLLAAGRLEVPDGMGGTLPTSGVAAWTGSNWAYLSSQNLGTSDVRAIAIYDADGPLSNIIQPQLYAASETGTLVWEGTGSFTDDFIDGNWGPITPGLSNGTRDMVPWDPDGLTGGLPALLAFIGTYPGVLDNNDDPGRVVIFDGAEGSRFAIDSFPFVNATRGIVMPLATGGSTLAVVGNQQLPFSDLPPNSSGVAMLNDGIIDLPIWNTIVTTDQPNNFPLAVTDDDQTGPNGTSLFIASRESGTAFSAGSTINLQNFARFELASTGVWSNPFGGNIFDGDNYNCFLIPGPTDFLTFDNNASNPDLDTRTVFLTDFANFAGIRALADNTTIDLAGNELFLVPTDPAQPAIVVGDGPTASTSLAFTSSTAFGFANSTLGKIHIATRDVGSFVDQRLFVGSNSQLDAESIDVGIAGRGGHLEVNSQVPGQISGFGVFAGFRVGIQPGSEGAVTVQGIPGATQATINPNGNGPTHIGVAGNGFMAIYPGGRFIGAATDFAIAVQPGSTGFLLQDNANNLLLLSSPIFSIGRGGLGGYEVNGGASAAFNDGNITIGELPTGTGTVTVRGAGSTLTHNQASGDVTVGAAGTGDLRVLDGGEFITSGTVNVGPRGALRGNGVVRATEGFVNNGSISPASELSIPGEDVPGSIGDLTIEGDFTQTGAGTIAIDLSQPVGTPLSRDTLTLVSNSVTLAGRLDIRFAEGTVIPDGSLESGLQVIQSTNAIFGAFDVATFPGLTPNRVTGEGRFLRYEVRQTSARGVPPSLVIVEDSLDGFIETTPPSNFDIEGAGTSAALGDLDNDGDQDLVITVPDPINPTLDRGSIIILFNAGNVDGYWQGFSSTAQILVGINPSGVAVGDFDAANGLDIAVVNSADGTLAILTNNGAGGFLPTARRGSTFVFPVGTRPNAVDAEDFNKDGRLDVVVSVAGEESIRILFNVGDVGEDWDGLSTPQSIELGSSAAGTTPVDVDDDKFDDIATPQPSMGAISITANNGAARGFPQFNEPISIFVGGEPVDIAAGDLNLDGFQDLVVARRGTSELAVLLGDGTIDLTPPTYVPAGSDPTSVALATLDQDNDLDIAVVTSNDQGQRVLRIIRNDLFGGDLNFAFQTDLFPGSDPVLVLSGDVTGDDAQDIVTLNTGGLISRGQPAVQNDVSVFTFSSCRGDATNDRLVNMDDLIVTLANWQNDYSPSTGPGDSDGNGVVNWDDVLSTLSFYGRICN